MKTSELFKKIEELGYVYDLDKHFKTIRVYTSGYTRENKEEYFKIDIDEFDIGKSYVVRSQDAKKLVRNILDYLDTPLEEREEEKKYRLKMPKEFNAGGLYVLKQDDIENYFLKSCYFENAQSVFTQKEIDAMPFDTSFFVKEEVK